MVVGDKQRDRERERQISGVKITSTSDNCAPHGGRQVSSIGPDHQLTGLMRHIPDQSGKAEVLQMEGEFPFRMINWIITQPRLKHGFMCVCHTKL